MVSVATFAAFWALHDFVLPQIGDMNVLMSSIHTQAEAFGDWKVVAAIAWTGERIIIAAIISAIVIIIVISMCTF